MSLADVARDFAPKGSGGDFWSPEDGGPAARVRWYRVKKGDELHPLPFTELQVWTGSAYSEPTPEIEATRQMLYATGSKEDKQKANGLKPRRKAWLTVVLVDNPTVFRIWKAPESVVQRLLCILAQKDPEGDGMPKKFEDTPTFYNAADRGAEVVCGPKGWDLAVRFDKKAGPSAMYDVVALDKPPAGFKVLPLTEEEAPDPQVTADRIKAARAKKEG